MYVRVRTLLPPTSHSDSFLLRIFFFFFACTKDHPSSRTESIQSIRYACAYAYFHIESVVLFRLLPSMPIVERTIKYANRCTFVWCGLLDLQLPNSQNICRNWIVLFTVAARSRCAAITADNDFSVVSCLFCCALKRWWNGDTGPSSNWKWSNNFWFIAIDQSTRERTCSCFCVEADVLMIFITSHSVFQSNDELIHIFVLDTFASFFHIIALDLRP